MSKLIRKDKIYGVTLSWFIFLCITPLGSYADDIANNDKSLNLPSAVPIVSRCREIGLFSFICADTFRLYAAGLADDERANLVRNPTVFEPHRLLFNPLNFFPASIGGQERYSASHQFPRPPPRS